MTDQPISKAELLASLPAPAADDAMPGIRAALAADGRKVVVLDDDPCGTQTVHDVAIITEWSVEALQRELADEAPAVFVLTNSRSLPADAAAALNRLIGANLREASQAAGRDFVVVSRSDSTLRGHFPAETDALAEALGGDFDGCLIVPFFAAGGRLTVGDVHYVAEGEMFIPAGRTPFAADAVFGYESSNLRQWVAEKSAGRVAAEDVHSISLEAIRTGGPERVAQLLGEVAGGAVCIVNAACRADVDVFVRGVLLAEGAGKRFLYRTAASFAAARSGISPRPLVTADELDLPAAGGGLIVCGSHVPKSTDQLAHLMDCGQVVAVEVDAEKLLDDGSRATEIARAAAEADAGLDECRDVAISTSRTLVTGADDAENLAIGRRISQALVEIVRAIGGRPRYLLAKGGITSSDLATDALGVTRAMVLGQVLPGVPVWRLGAESRYPDMPYVVFPGNVGDADAVTKIVTGLRR